MQYEGGTKGYRLLRWLVAALALAWTAWISLVPVSSLPSVNIWDKAAHFLNYGFLTLLLASLFGRRRQWSAAAMVMLYGVLIEFVQGQGGQRLADWRDIVANGAGILAALALLAVVHWFRDRRGS